MWQAAVCEKVQIDYKKKKTKKTARIFVSYKPVKLLKNPRATRKQHKSVQNPTKNDQKVAQQEKWRKQRQIKVLQSSTFWQNKNAKVTFSSHYFAYAASSLHS